MLAQGECAVIYKRSSSETCCPWRNTPSSFAIVLLNHLLPGETIFATDKRYQWGSWSTCCDGEESVMFYNSTSRTPAGTVLTSSDFTLFQGPDLNFQQWGDEIILYRVSNGQPTLLCGFFNRDGNDCNF